eukprot:3060335-Pyramimonas_sp.AAC.1
MLSIAFLVPSLAHPSTLLWEDFIPTITNVDRVSNGLRASQKTMEARMRLSSPLALCPSLRRRGRR